LRLIPPRLRSATASNSLVPTRDARLAGALLFWAPVFLLAGCARHATPAVAVVNGTRLSPEVFSAYVQEATRGVPEALDAASRERELTTFEALSAAALAEQAHADSHAQAAAELARLEALAHAGAERARVYAPPTEEDLKAAYAKYLATEPAREYHVAHILVATDTQAREVIEKLNRGHGFADVATRESTDESKVRGGDLGWIQPGHLPAAFMSAVQSLKPMEFTQTPVKSPYGWHVIELREDRAVELSSFDSVKAQLAANLIAERYQVYLADALRTAKIARP
jgi:peptidyl-prolyl cis-trans isomerase C